MPDENPRNTLARTLRLAEGVREMRTDLRLVHNTLDQHTATLAGHTALHNLHMRRSSALEARFDSIDRQLRTLAQMVGDVLNRLPEEPNTNS